MFLRLIFAIVVLIAIFTIWHKIKKADPKTKKDMTMKIVIGLVIAAIIAGAAMGRVHWLGAVAAALVPIARWGFRYGLPLSKLWLAKNGGNATFSTVYLKVSFNVNTGQVDGEILDGPHANSTISNLSEKQIDELIAYYAEHDRKSYYLAMAIKQRLGFNSNTHQGAAPPSMGAPERAQALEILGLKGSPTRKEILAAHRALINKLHPDRGGNDFLAAQVNDARDQLLKELDD